MIKPEYKAQVDLLLQLLPYVAKEEIFALKGDTAINLFVRDLPRLSVDMDLTYLPFDVREDALKNIYDGLGRIKTAMEKAIPKLKVHTVSQNGGMDVKLNCQHSKAQIKIEVNTTTRGHLFPVRMVREIWCRTNLENLPPFRWFLIQNYTEEKYAALDRQHPRDLFDVKLLLENEGFTHDVKQGFVLALLSHYKPIHELLNPVFKNQEPVFHSQFAGMTTIEFSYKDYKNTRTLLLETLKKHLSEDDKKLIFSFEKGKPDWSLFSHKIIRDFPAIQWKLQNIEKLIQENPKKYGQLTKRLEKVLG